MQIYIAQYGTIWHNHIMLSYQLTPDLIAKLRELENQFSLCHAKYNNLSEAESTAIHHYARISNIGASTRIENALLTDSEVNWLDTILTADGRATAFIQNKQLLEDKLSKDRERSIEEVAGCRVMMMLIYDKAQDLVPLREYDLRALHTELIKPYQKNNALVGNYKIQPNSVIETNHATKKIRVVFKTATAGPITQSAMRDLITWYNQSIHEEAWTIAVICEFVYRFLAIHPFQDGNGRLGRGLFLCGLLQSGNQALETLAPYLAIDRQIEKHKEDYYYVLNACSNGAFSQNPKNYKIQHFLKFMIKMLLLSMADIEVYRKKYQAVNQLSASATKVLACFKEHPEIRLNTKILCTETLLPRRTVIHSINSLLAADLIQKYGQGAGTRYQITF